jgi:hypothetical protein
VKSGKKITKIDGYMNLDYNILKCTILVEKNYYFDILREPPHLKRAALKSIHAFIRDDCLLSD